MNSLISRTAAIGITSSAIALDPVATGNDAVAEPSPFTLSDTAITPHEFDDARSESDLTPIGTSGYEITWYTIDGGGGTSEATGFSLSGTIGQPDAGTLSGGGYTLAGG